MEEERTEIASKIIVHNMEATNNSIKVSPFWVMRVFGPNLGKVAIV